MARVEPYETGTYKFFCDCEYEYVRFGCSRVVNDSEPNFSCERPIIDAKDQKCKFRWKFAPLVAAYEKQKAQDDSRAYLASEARKKADALKTLGLTEAQYNATLTPSVSKQSSSEEK